VSPRAGPQWERWSGVRVSDAEKLLGSAGLIRRERRDRVMSDADIDLLAEPRRAVTLAELREHREEILAIGRRVGVSNIRVFGSVARGEADDQSDLDLLVDVAPGVGLEIVDFALGVQDLMQVFTEIVTVSGLKQRIRGRVLAEAVPL
jgi:predicted nucleotidyltransferase